MAHRRGMGECAAQDKKNVRVSARGWPNTFAGTRQCLDAFQLALGIHIKVGHERRGGIGFLCTPGY